MSHELLPIVLTVVVVIKLFERITVLSEPPLVAWFPPAPMLPPTLIPPEFIKKPLPAPVTIKLLKLAPPVAPTSNPPTLVPVPPLTTRELLLPPAP